MAAFIVTFIVRVGSDASDGLANGNMTHAQAGDSIYVTKMST